MRLIVLLGLMAIEKAVLAAELAGFLAMEGHSVTVIDNIARLPMSTETLPAGRLLRLEGDPVQQLGPLLAAVQDDVALLAASETAAPEELLAALAALAEERPDLQVFTLGLLDLRTCDCFPQGRALLEQEADAVLLAPFDLQQALRALA